jgi:hypothetical protein
MDNGAAKGVIGAMQVIMDSWFIFTGAAWYIFFLH